MDVVLAIGAHAVEEEEIFWELSDEALVGGACLDDVFWTGKTEHRCRILKLFL